jgi:hypothetical protein
MRPSQCFPSNYFLNTEIDEQQLFVRRTLKAKARTPDPSPAVKVAAPVVAVVEPVAVNSTATAATPVRTVKRRRSLERVAGVTPLLLRLMPRRTLLSPLLTTLRSEFLSIPLPLHVVCDSFLNGFIQNCYDVLTGRTLRPLPLLSLRRSN